METKFMKPEDHIAAVNDFQWHLSFVLNEARKSAINRLMNEVDRDCVEIDGDLYKVGKCIEEGHRSGEGYYIVCRYKANGELCDHDSLAEMHLEARDSDPDEGDYEEWELIEEIYNKTEDEEI